MYVVEVDCTRSLWVLWKSYLLCIFARCYIFSLLQLPWPSLPIELTQFNKSYIYTASVPLPNGCPLIYRLRLGHLLPHRYSCKTDSIDIPLLGDVEGSSIVCKTRKLEEFPDADCDDTECLSSILRSIKNLLLLFQEDPEKYLVYLSCRAGFQSFYKHRHKNKHHVCRTLTTCPAPKILLPDLWNVSNFPQWVNEIDHSAGISGYGSITMAAKMSMANY